MAHCCLKFFYFEVRKMIKWGILGAGNIAHRFAESLKYFKDCRLEAISGRNESKLIEFSTKFSVDKIYLDHQKMLKDPEIDCIYIAVPHQVHKQWIISALKNKKAVLCEKPSVLNKKDLLEIKRIAIENKTLFMEAMKSRFVPAYRLVKEQLEKGLIGKIYKITTSFCSIFPDEDFGKTYHTDPSSRGALYDTGIYGAALLTDFYTDLLSIRKVKFKIQDGIILDINAELEFKEGTGIIKCSFIKEEPRSAVFEGTEGILILNDFYRATSFTIIKNDEVFNETVSYENDDFYSQIKHFLKLYKMGKLESPIMSFKDSYRAIEVLESIYDQLELR